MLGQPVAVSRAYFDSHCGISSSLLSRRELESYRPEFHSHLGLGQDLLFIKTHEMCRLTEHGEHLFPKEGCRGTVYLTRHPFDVAKSWSHHQQVTLETAVQDLNDPEFTLNRQTGTLHTHFEELVGCWSDHVKSWRRYGPKPLLLVRYEDLVRSPTRAFRDILVHCGLSLSQRRLERALEMTTFSALASLESRTAFRGKQPTAPSFFRIGEAGDGASLSAELKNLIVSKNEEMMLKLAYRFEGESGPLRK